MPFTFAHPAIILPLLNKRNKLFSATGLIVGSIAPDFESFITVDDRKYYSHTWTGMFWYDLPLALGIAILFHAIVRDPLIENLPKPLAERFEMYRGFKWFTYLRQHFLVVIFSLFIGILSHLLWDAFTHLNLADPDAITSTVKVFGHRLYIILQFGCSALGLLVVAWAIYRLPKKKVLVKTKMKYQYWLILLLLAILADVILTPIAAEGVDIYLYPILIIYIAISSVLAALVVVSIVYTTLLKRQH